LDLSLLFFINMIKIITEHRKSILLILIVVIAISFILFSDRGLIKRISLNSQRSELQNKIKEELHNRDSLLNSMINYNSIHLKLNGLHGKIME